VLFDAVPGAVTSSDDVTETPSSLIRWSSGPAIAVVYLKRPHDGVLRFGVAIGENDGVDASPRDEFDDRWEDAAADLHAHSRGAPRISPFALVSDEFETPEMSERGHVIVSWGITHPAVAAVAVSGSAGATPTVVVGCARVFLAAAWFNDTERSAAMDRGGLALRGLNAAGEQVAGSRIDDFGPPPGA
jgi:hypothetical protein